MLKQVALIALMGMSASAMAGQWQVKVGGSVIAPIGYSNAILSTGMLLAILPLIILYIFCQRLFVESLASTGVKI